MARNLGPGHTIVTILCDYETDTNQLFNKDFLTSKQLPVPPWLNGNSPDIVSVFEE